MQGIISKAHAELQTMEKTCAMFQKGYAHEIPTVYILRKRLSSQCGKSDIFQTIISKLHAHSHTMEKTLAKFHNDWYKTVREVALTRGTYCHILRVKND